MRRQDLLYAALEEIRAETLHFFQEVDEADFTRQVHRDFSPLGWHLGHIGVTEAYWILQRCKGSPSLSPFYDSFFTPTDNPKPNRVHLPPRQEILEYLHVVRRHVLAFLTTVEFHTTDPLLVEANIFNMLLQHEAQHLETMTLIRHLLVADRYREEEGGGTVPLTGQAGVAVGCPDPTLVYVPAGPFSMGSSDLSLTLDNERPQHNVRVDGFWIEREPVTNSDFLYFIQQGGYHEQRWWSRAGWDWRERAAVEHPLYWRLSPQGGWQEIRSDGLFPLLLHRPITGISWYEADAYARALGKRLPTESEWEKAASGGYLVGVGEVWEWTATWFHPYAGFMPHPYCGYSVPYFDCQHRVLKGGSWATRPPVRRWTFRNWYQPWVREIFAGVRCAQD